MFLHLPNVTSMDVFGEVEIRKGDVNFESEHPGLPETSWPINTQLSMAFSAPLSQCQDVNIFEHYNAFHTSYAPSIIPTQHFSVNFDFDAIFEWENQLIRDVLSDISEDEGELPDGDDLDTNLKEAFHVEENI